MVDEIIYGDVRFIQGAVAIVAIAALAYVDALLAYFDHGLDTLLEGKPSVIVRDGDFERKGMRAERMNEKDVFGHLRTQGISDMREVRLAVVEHDGTVSVLKHSWAEPASKADVLDAEERARNKVFGEIVLLVLVRLSGKRTVRQATFFDFTVALIVGDIVDDFLWAEVAASEFVVAAATVLLADMTVLYFRFRAGTR